MPVSASTQEWWIMRLSGPLHVLNEGLAFVLEVIALALLAWWGFATGGNLVVKILLGLGTPLAAAVLWGMFAAPKARFKVPIAGVLVVKALVFAAGALALWALHYAGLGIGFAALALVNTALATLDREALMNQAR
jgi:hypothetical protein